MSDFKIGDIIKPKERQVMDVKYMVAEVNKRGEVDFGHNDMGDGGIDYVLKAIDDIA